MEMTEGKKFFLIILAIICCVALLFFACTPAGIRVFNQYEYSLEKADEQDYAKQKEVEDTARAYIASYNADIQIYQTYQDSDDEDLRQYAESARIRAINTATAYNEYLRKNSFVWKDNIPSDLPFSLSTDF